MSSARAIFFLTDEKPLPDPVAMWAGNIGSRVETVSSADDLMAMALRGHPPYVILDARTEPDRACDALRRLKQDSYTGIVPAAVLSAGEDSSCLSAFASLADEVLRDFMSHEEITARLNAMLQRSVRDTSVHPSTRLPGAGAIEAEITRQMQTGAQFAVCYADLDHFKEFNDRYSYTEGDRVIRILARVLHDVVKGMCGERGFVGHIGGDDFIFIIPTTAVDETCTEIVATFDLIARYQYSAQDRRAGYFFGKDRRGNLHRVPLMTLSIGVVTNLRRQFTTASQVSQLATEMKTYAKTLPGSVYTVDRRTEGRPTPSEPMLAITDAGDEQ